LSDQPTGYIKFNDNIVADYTRQVGESMMPPARWARAAAWELYDLALSIKNVGDTALRMGSDGLDTGNYKHCQQVFQGALANNTRVADLEDQGFHQAGDRLSSVCGINMCLATVLGKGLREGGPMVRAKAVLKGTENLDGWYRENGSDIAVIRLHHYRAVALAMTGESKLAMTELKKASHREPSNERLSVTLQRLSAKATANTTKDKKALLTAMRECLSTEPLGVDPPTFIPSEQVAGERYTLCKFGYKGDTLEHIPASKAVDKAEIDKIFTILQKQQAKFKETPWIGWFLKADADKDALESFMAQGRTN